MRVADREALRGRGELHVDRGELRRGAAATLIPNAADHLAQTRAAFILMHRSAAVLRHQRTERALVA